MDFWAALEQLVCTSQPVIDHPKGSTHPRYPDVIYPLDYGYLENTTGGDDAGIDIWLGESGNFQQISGVICTVDVWKRDAEVKILLGCTTDEMRRIQAFVNADGMGGTLIERPPNRNGN